MMVDTIVIGNDISSLIAAVSCCRKGMQTLLIQDGERPVVFSDSGYTFNTNPLPWTGLNDGHLSMHPLLKEWLHHPEDRFLTPLVPALQVILPEHRLDIHSNRDRLMKEVEREFPGSRAVVDTFYESALRASMALTDLIGEFPYLRPRNLRTAPRFINLLSAFLREKNSYLKKWSTLLDDSLLRFLEAQMIFLSGYCYDGMEKALTSPFALSLPLQGLFYPRGGKHVLINALRDELLSQGGSTVEGCDINGVTFNPGRCHVEWRSADGQESVSSGGLILSAGWMKLESFLSGHKRLKRLSNRLRRSEIFLHSFTLHLGVLDRGLPEQMAEYVVILASPTERSLKDHNLIFLEISLRGDAGRAPEGKRALSATIFMDADPSALPDEALRGIASQIFQRLKEILPFLDEHLDYFELEKCLEMARIPNPMACRRYTVMRNPLSPISGMSNRTPLKNVVLTGGSLMAGLGFAGEVLSGVNAANLLFGENAR